MRKPEECQYIEDVQDAIDKIDRNIISFIAERAEYVHSAVKFKTDKTSVKAEDGVKAMLNERVEWASEKGLNPELIVKIYSDLVNFFINSEMAEWVKENDNL